MSGPDFPDTPPPEVPEEFAAAYAEAFRRAMESGESPELGPGPDVEPGAQPGPAPDSALEAFFADAEPEVEHPPHTHVAPGERPRWLVPALVSGLALVLVIGAYGAGKLFSDDGPDRTGATDSTASTAPTTPVSPSRSATRSPSKRPSDATSADAWEGAVTPVIAAEPEATCTARPSVDAAGATVRYEAGNTLDGDAATAWRCDGSAEGERITFELPEGTELGEVGLIPGYAKTDAKSGADRYVENNRITRVRWTLADGVTVVQNFDPDPQNRAVQTLRVPRTATDEVTLEILGVSRGPRNTTAISEVAFAAAEGDDSSDDD